MSFNISFSDTSFGINNRLDVDFAVRLQHRGTDFKVYANAGYTPAVTDSPLLKRCLRALLTDDSGVDEITVSPFTIEVYYSRAVSETDIKSRIIGASRKATMQTPVVVVH